MFGRHHLCKNLFSPTWENARSNSRALLSSSSTLLSVQSFFGWKQEAIKYKEIFYMNNKICSSWTVSERSTETTRVFIGSLVYIISLAAYNRDERTLSPETYRIGRDCYCLIDHGVFEVISIENFDNLVGQAWFPLRLSHYQQFSVFHSLGLSHSIYTIEFDKPPASAIIIWRHITSERTFKHFYCPIYGLIFNNTCWLLFTQSANHRLHWF